MKTASAKRFAFVLRSRGLFLEYENVCHNLYIINQF